MKPMRKNEPPLRLYVFVIFALMVLRSGSSSHASETDSFTDRCKPLEDTRIYLNGFVNSKLDEAVAQANRDARRRYLRTNYPFRARQSEDYCHSEDLYRHIRYLFARKFIGQMEAHINSLPQGMKRSVPLARSIYRDFPLIKSPTLVGTQNMGSLVRMGHCLIGADKFGHFFTEGWTGFNIAYRGRNPDIKASVEYGELTESLYYGVMTTGVYSHADLVANFNGMRFYNAITGENPDPLGSGNMPEAYVRCLDRQWKRIRDFDWLDYVDAAWDEAVNLNYFRDEDLLEKALKRMEETLKSQPDDCGCTASDPEKSTLETKYGHFSASLLNLSAPATLPEPLKPEQVIRKKLAHILSLIPHGNRPDSKPFD